MDNLGFYIYILGGIISLGIGIYEMIKDKNPNHEKREYGLIS